MELDKETDEELRKQLLARLMGPYISGIQLAQTLLSAASEEEKQEKWATGNGWGSKALAPVHELLTELQYPSPSWCKIDILAGLNW